MVARACSAITMPLAVELLTTLTTRKDDLSRGGAPGARRATLVQLVLRAPLAASSCVPQDTIIPTS
jgi:hypothetical protein